MVTELKDVMAQGYTLDEILDGVEKLDMNRGRR